MQKLCLKSNGKHGLWLKICAAAILPPLALLGYAAWWGVAYRLPRAQDKTIDMRSVTYGQPRQLVFCAGLANNPHGYPGHAYVIWPDADKPITDSTETLGYCPAEFWSIVPSVYEPVAGVVDERAATGNGRNVERLIVWVDQKTFDHTRRLARQWDNKGFRTGSRDCCAFVDYIAQGAGLSVPVQKYLYPHDHIHLLKELNAGREPVESTVSAE